MASAASPTQRAATSSGTSVKPSPPPSAPTSPPTSPLISALCADDPQDALTALKAGKTISEVFAADGEARFREIESSVLAEVLEHVEPIEPTLEVFAKWMSPDARLLVSLPTENQLYRLFLREVRSAGRR